MKQQFEVIECIFQPSFRFHSSCLRFVFRDLFLEESRVELFNCFALKLVILTQQ